MKINAVSEEPAATPDAAPEQPSRYDRNFGGLLAAMLVTVLFVAAYVGFRALTRDQPSLDPDVDYASCVAYLQEADVSVVYPQELPSGWTANVIHFARGNATGVADRPAHGPGRVRRRGPAGGATSTTCSTQYVDENPSQGEDAAPANGLGVTSWQTWSDDGGDHAFSTELTSGPLAGETLLVYGSAPVADQETLLARAHARPGVRRRLRQRLRHGRVLPSRPPRRRLEGLVEPLAHPVEPLLADRGELLAALPERQRLLERGAAGLEPAHRLDELLAGGLVGQLRRPSGAGRASCQPSFSSRSSVRVVVACTRPSATRTLIAAFGATPATEVTTCPSASWSTA